jgi:hypothetical protein
MVFLEKELMHNDMQEHFDSTPDEALGAAALEFAGILVQYNPSSEKIARAFLLAVRALCGAADSDPDTPDLELMMKGARALNRANELYIEEIDKVMAIYEENQ